MSLPVYILKRILQAIPLLIIVSIMSFIIIKLSPVDPLAELKLNPAISPQVLQAEKQRLGLDLPVYKQYFQDIKKLVDEYRSKMAKLKLLKENLSKIIKEIIQEDESLHKWFKRQGPSGKEGGWVDCNTCRTVDGKKKCKSCGRKEGEKRSKYPSCRPTPSQCGKPGKGKTWGKTK